MAEEASVRFAVVDINEILKTLPHRYPMLLIDKVLVVRLVVEALVAKMVPLAERFVDDAPALKVWSAVQVLVAGS